MMSPLMGLNKYLCVSRPSKFDMSYIFGNWYEDQFPNSDTPNSNCYIVIYDNSSNICRIYHLQKKSRLNNNIR